MVDYELIKRLAKDIVSSRRTVALTGAGISTESGIPDFRGPHGIWKKYDPKDFTYSAFISDPKKFWILRVQRMKEGFDVLKAKPNPAHYALARLEELGLLHCIITQNIDGLHQKAGSKHVIEFHGDSRRAKCIKCGNLYPMEEAVAKVEKGEIPPKCSHCGGILKPNTVLFEEPIPYEALTESQREARTCTLMIVAGTSAVVYPAADLPRVAKMAGAKVVEVNAEPTPLTGIISDYIIEGKCGEILPKVVEEVEKILKEKGNL